LQTVLKVEMVSFKAALIICFHNSLVYQAMLTYPWHVIVASADNLITLMMTSLVHGGTKTRRSRLGSSDGREYCFRLVLDRPIHHLQCLCRWIHGCWTCFRNLHWADRGVS